MDISVNVNPFTCLRVTFEIAVWVFDIFDNNLKIKNPFRKYLKERFVGDVLMNISPSNSFTKYASG